MNFTFNKSSNIDPLWITLAALFAKTSVAWPSLLNMLANREIRSRLPGRRKKNKELMVRYATI